MKKERLYESIELRADLKRIDAINVERIQIAQLDNVCTTEYPRANPHNRHFRIQIAQMGFQGMKELNLIQSVVFETAYGSNENLLISAPTGAGKTNIAMLTVLHEIKQNIGAGGKINLDEFKIIYVAPMKALAAEMTASFSKRLHSLGICVRECTGDIPLTKQEISKTQVRNSGL